MEAKTLAAKLWNMDLRWRRFRDLLHFAVDYGARSFLR
jgi:hypothetical protein